MKKTPENFKRPFVREGLQQVGKINISLNFESSDTDDFFISSSDDDVKISTPLWHHNSKDRAERILSYTTGPKQ